LRSIKEGLDAAQRASIAAGTVPTPKPPMGAPTSIRAAIRCSSKSPLAKFDLL